MDSEKVEQKNVLRKYIRNLLKSMSDEDYLKESHLLSKNVDLFFKNLNVIQEKKIVGAYAPFEREPNWFCEIEEENLFLSFPISTSQENQMIFRKSKINELINRNDFGSKILGPENKKEEVVPELILIPGLAFNLRGERLGRGKGYFDRYLCSFHGLKVGICFEDQLVDEIPTDEYDVKMDWLVTNKKIYKIP